jgi:hypothetical protein
VLTSVCFVLAFVCFFLNLSLLIVDAIIHNFFEEEKEKLNEDPNHDE